MANQIRLKRASGSDPSASDLVTGELAVRTDTAKLFTKKDDNSVAEIGGGLSNVVEDTSPQLGGTLESNGQLISFGDSSGSTDDRLKFGNGEDFNIYHNGTDTVLTNATGDLYINNAGSNSDDIIFSAKDDVLIKVQDGETAINCVGDGAVELYHDNSKKFETHPNGVLVTGHIYAADNKKILLGNSADLEIFHDGSHSRFLDNGTGKLQFGSDTGVEILTGNFATQIALFDSSQILLKENTSVTGNISVSGTVDGRDLATDGTKLDGIESNATADQTAAEIKTLLNSNQLEAAQIANNAITAGKLPNSEVTFAKLQDVSQNRIIGRISSGSGVLQELTAANIRSIINVADGANVGIADLVSDTSPQLGGDLDANGNNIAVDGGNNITIGDNGRLRLGASNDLDIYHSGSHSIILENGTGNLQIAASTIQFTNSAIDENMIIATADAGVELYFNNVKKFESTVRGVEISGNATNPLSSLSDGSTITVDFGASCNFTVTLGGNRTFGDPDNTASSVGSSGSIFIVQDGTGSRTASFHSDYKFAGGTAPTLSTAANAVDRLDYIVRANNDVHCVVTLDVK